MTPSPIMTMFQHWNAIRNRSEEPGISDDEVNRRVDETDEVMERLLALPCRDATDLAAKVMCFTHFGNYDLDDAEGGTVLMQEMAAMVGQSEQLDRRFKPARLYVHQERGVDL